MARRPSQPIYYTWAEMDAGADQRPEPRCLPGGQYMLFPDSGGVLIVALCSLCGLPLTKRYEELVRRALKNGS